MPCLIHKMNWSEQKRISVSIPLSPQLDSGSLEARKGFFFHPRHPVSFRFQQQTIMFQSLGCKFQFMNYIEE